MSTRLCYLEETDLHRVIRAAYESEDLRQHMVTLVLFYAATRISQALSLRGSDLFRYNGKWALLVRGAKGGNDVVHYLHFSDDPAFDMTPLLELAQKRMFSKLFGGLTPQYFNIKLKEIALQAGIHQDYAHSHVFRHSAAMIIMNRTQRVGAVTKALGHKSASSAFVYLQENDAQLAQDVLSNFTPAEIAGKPQLVEAVA